MAALLVTALPAVAKEKVAIVELTSPPTMMGLAAQVTQTVLQSAKQQRFAVVGPDELREKLGEKTYEELRNCEGKVTCVAARVQGVDVQRVVVGSLTRDERSYLIKLWLIDLEKMQVLADVDRAILIASRRLTLDVGEAVPRLLRGEKEARGTLKLTCNVKNAQVTVNGERVGTAPLSLELKPGKHEVHIQKKAYLPVQRLLTVEANRVTEEEVRLLLIPGAQPEEEEVPALVQKDAKEKSAGGLHVPAPAWIAGGVALVAGGAGALFGVRAERTQRELREGFNPDTGVYAGTRQQALDAQSNATVANVLFGVAGAAAVTGVVLTLIGVGEEEPQTSVAPAVGPGAAGLVLGGRF